jgi:GNAT superfamily N-acetyltransferase
MKIYWQEINAQNEKLWNQAITLYEKSFHIDLREPSSVFRRSLEISLSTGPNAFHFLVGYDEQQKVIALSTAHYFADVNFGFIVYLVVDTFLQGHGIGSQLLVQTEELLQKDAVVSPLRGIILESERVEDAETEQEKKECQRRNRFFAFNHFEFLNDVTYFQPPLHSTTKPVRLNLWVKLRVGTPGLNAREVEELVDQMYTEKYFRMNQLEPAQLEICKERLIIRN